MRAQSRGHTKNRGRPGAWTQPQPPGAPASPLQVLTCQPSSPQETPLTKRTSSSSASQETVSLAVGGNALKRTRRYLGDFVHGVLSSHPTTSAPRAGGQVHSPQRCSSEPSAQSRRPSQCLLEGRQVPFGQRKPLHLFSEMEREAWPRGNAGAGRPGRAPPAPEGNLSRALTMTGVRAVANRAAWRTWPAHRGKRRYRVCGQRAPTTRKR